MPAEGVRGLRRPAMPKASRIKPPTPTSASNLPTWRRATSAPPDPPERGGSRAACFRLAAVGREIRAPRWRSMRVPEAVAAEAVPAGEEGDEVTAALPAADPVAVDDGLAVASASAIPPNPTAVPTGPVLPPAVMSIDPALTVPLSPPVHPKGRRARYRRCGSIRRAPSRPAPEMESARSAPPHRAPRQMVPAPCPRSRRALRRTQPALRKETQPARCKASPSSVAKRTWRHRCRRRLLGR